MFDSAVKGLLGPFLIKEQQLATKSLVYFRQLLEKGSWDLDFSKAGKLKNTCFFFRQLLFGLVGDGLLEPFWPTGTGIAR
jgi:hypothetical protein